MQNNVFVLDSISNRNLDFNVGNNLRLIGFIVAEIPAQIISKKVGPDRWIPIEMFAWSVVSASQFWLTNKPSFYATRFLVGL